MAAWTSLWSPCMRMSSSCTKARSTWWRSHRTGSWSPCMNTSSSGGIWVVLEGGLGQCDARTQVLRHELACGVQPQICWRVLVPRYWAQAPHGSHAEQQDALCRWWVPPHHDNQSVHRLVDVNSKALRQGTLSMSIVNGTASESALANEEICRPGLSSQETEGAVQKLDRIASASQSRKNENQGLTRSENAMKGWTVKQPNPCVLDKFKAMQRVHKSLSNCHTAERAKGSTYNTCNLHSYYI